MRRELMLALPLLLLTRPLGAQVSRFAGTWAFRVAGDDPGSGVATADSLGTIRGSGSTTYAGPITLAGTVGADGAMALTASPSGVVSTTATFSGRADASGHASGTWINRDANMSGTWRATRRATPVEPATGISCEAGSGPVPSDRFSPVQVSASYTPATQRVHLTFVARTPGPAVEHWLLAVHAVPVTGVGAAPIVNQPGFVSTISHRNPGQGSPDRRTARGTLTLTALSGPVGGGPGRMSGTLDMEADPYRVRCRFDLRATFSPANARRPGTTP